jgi:NADPH:quinone reductase-like Zn-dependent oxidoreductase
VTAWRALFDAAGLKEGQKVLIHGAAGGVGSFAVQLAKWKGAHVIGTASTRNQAFLRQLGVDEPIDYEKIQFEDVVHDVDAVLDPIGGDTQKRSWKTLKKGGILVSIVGPPSAEEAKNHRVRSAFMATELFGDYYADQVVDTDSSAQRGHVFRYVLEHAMPRVLAIILISNGSDFLTRGTLAASTERACCTLRLCPRYGSKAAVLGACRRRALADRLAENESERVTTIRYLRNILWLR